MIDYPVFRSIKTCQYNGLSERETSEKLNLNRKTVHRYWNLTDSDYDASAPSRIQIARYSSYIYDLQAQGKSLAAICADLKSTYDFDVNIQSLRRFLTSRVTSSVPHVHTSNAFEMNSRNNGDGMELLNCIFNDCISACFFDPEYRGVLNHLEYGNEGKRQSRRIILPQMNTETINAYIKEINRVLKPSGYLFLWQDKYELLNSTQQWIADTDLKIVDMLVWNKCRIGMGFRTRHACEPLLILQKPPVRAKMTWTDHAIPDVWSEKVQNDHPHRKPFLLQKLLILSVTKPGDVILDPCAGSFSVLDACQNANRDFLGTDVAASR